MFTLEDFRAELAGMEPFTRLGTLMGLTSVHYQLMVFEVGFFTVPFLANIARMWPLTRVHPIMSH